MLGFSFSFRDVTEITLCTLILQVWSFYRSSTEALKVYIYLLGTLISCYDMIHSETEKKVGLQQFFLKQEVAVTHWSLQLSPAKAGYHANTSSTCHACLPSQPFPEAVLAPWCLSLPGSFCRFPTPSLWQDFHCCCCRVPGFVLVKAGTNTSWI